MAGNRDCVISAPQSMIQSGNHALLREICGFDSRAYKRASKEGTPEPVIEAIESNERLLKRND
ncbi:MAG: hypothetical protein D6698_04385 [Gammaproteobacteria bacterium]|nr:MAG: hypothetical protein D6698_04385 [Gammaproteobacteria bacterium]